MSVKQKSKAKYDNFDTYIRKIQNRENRGELGLNSETVRTLDAIVKILGNLIGSKASELTRDSKKRTISAREIMTSVKLLFTKELSKSVSVEAAKALARYDGAMADAGGKSEYSVHTSDTNKAGLTLSVSRMRFFLRGTSRAERISKGALVYLAAVLEYVIAEILKSAGNYTREGKKVRIRTTDIRTCLHNDADLKELLYGGRVQIEGI